MSLKLKGVELDAFRAFNDKKSFNFKNTKFDEISNLIVLYAPNGTGKTTFFDAIEWGMSGQIQRISNNKNASDIAQKERDRILKNQDSSATFATVELKFSDETSYKLATKEIKGKRTTDYDEGNELEKTVDLTNNELSKVIKTNLLTHDQIDNFLRFQSSEKRYEAMRTFWDKENQTEDYKSLVLLVIEINKSMDSKNAEIMSLKEEINKIEINPEIWKEIDRLKELYTEIDRKKDETLNDIKHLQEMYIKSNSQKSKNQNEITNIEKKKRQIEMLAKDFKEEYLQFPDHLKICEEKIKSHKKIAGIFYEIEKNTEYITELLKEKTSNKENLKRCEFINEYRKTYELQKETQSNLKKRLEELIQQRKDVEKAILQIQSELHKEEGDLVNQKKVNQDLIEELRVLESLNVYPTENEKYENLKRELGILEKSKLNIETKLLEFQQKSDSLLSLLSLSIKDLFNKDIYNNNNYSFLIAKFKQASTTMPNLKLIEESIEKKKYELISLEKIGSNVEQLKKLGYSITKATESTICPLCEQDYEDFEKLIEKIQCSTSAFIQTTNITEKISELELSHDKLNKTLQQVYKEIQNNICEESKLLENEINLLSEQKISVNLEYSIKQTKISESEEILNNVKSSILNYEIEIDKFEEHLNRKIHLKKEQIEKIEKKCNDLELTKIEKEKLKVFNSNQLENIELESNKVKNELSDIEENNQYKKYVQELLYFENNDVSEVTDFLRKYEKKLESLKIKEKELFNEKRLLVDQVNGKSKLETEEIITTLERKILELWERKSQIEIESNNIFGEIVDEKFDFNGSQNMLSNEISILEKKNEVLSQLAGISNNFINENTLELKKEELKKKEENYQILNDKSKEFTRLKTSYLSFIKMKIENTFNLDIVNKIFQMIEPHPEFREISFKIDESNPDRLGLNIMCKKSDETEDAPILYLSSAQVNILSMSIFLGIALENTDNLNTIFMDDPVQHLDSLNELSFIDLLRILSFNLDKQIIFSTHSQHFFNLCKRKLSDQYYSSSFIEINNLNNSI